MPNGRWVGRPATCGGVGFVINNLGTGGAERVFVDDLNALHRDGHPVHLFLLCGPQHPCPLERELALPVSRRVRLGRTAGKPFLRAVWRLWWQVRRRRLKTLYASVGDAVMVASLVAWLSPGLRLVIREANPFSRHRRHVQRAAPLLFRRATTIAGVSAAVATELRTALPCVAARVQVLRNAVALPDIPPEPGACDPSILCVGSFKPGKNHAMLVAAFAALAPHHPDASLTLVGEGPERAQLEAMVQSADLGHRVHLPGALPHTTLAEYYRSASIFALPSDHEGCPNALLEAMAHGLPCVSTAPPGMDELIEDGVSGVLVPVRDTGAFIDALERLLDDAPLRGRLGAAARARMAAHFNPDHRYRQLLKLLELA